MMSLSSTSDVMLTCLSAFVGPLAVESGRILSAASTLSYAVRLWCPMMSLADAVSMYHRVATGIATVGQHTPTL